MKVENVWTGTVALIFGIAIVIGFGVAFSGMLTVADTEIKIFLGVLFSGILIAIAVFSPIENILSDDKGGSN